MNQLFVVTVPGGSVTKEENEKEYLKSLTVEPGKPRQILKWDGEKYRWVSHEDHLSELKAEFVSSITVRFLNEDSVTAYDSKGNVCMCKCGRKAITTLFFLHGQIHYCNNCYLELKNEK